MAVPVSDQAEKSASVDPSILVPGARLAGLDLTGVDISNLDLSGVDLSGADLTDVRATKTCLKGANLQEAKLDGAQFLHADLSSVDLAAARAVGAAFGGCLLSDASLFGSDFTNTSLSQANLQGADLRMTTFRGARLRAADLTGVDASRADFSETDLTEAILSEAILHETDLSGARLQSVVGYRTTDWVGCNTTQADFTGAYLARRAMIDQNYLHEFRSQSKLHEWIYRLWWITSDCGRSYVRWGGWTLLFALVFAGLYGFVEIDYGDEPTALSSLYFSIVTLTTLGYGDILPVSQTAQAVVITQVVIGYVMLGGLLSTFSSKMSRRGE